MKVGEDYIGVTTPFYCNDGKGNFLFNKRSKKCRDEQGKWDTGGGKLEFGLTPEENVLKEVKEEYGCKGIIQKSIPPFTLFRTNNIKKTHWIVFPFLVKVKKSEVKIGDPVEIDELGWFRLNKLPTPLHPGVSYTLKHHKKYFRDSRSSVSSIPTQTMGTVVIVLSGNKIMLGKRKNSYGAGLYGLPGGRVESSEKLVDCAKRELTEETGLKVNRLNYVGVVRDLHEDYSFMHFVFLCKSYKGKPCLKEPDKCEAWEWFARNKIPTNILPGHKAAIEIFLNPSRANVNEVSSV